MITATRRRHRPVMVAAALVYVALAGVSCNSLVGAECAADFAQCNSSCVDTQNDPDNCGGCGVVCAGTCSAGACVDDGDGGLGDGGDSDDAGRRPDGGNGRDGGDGGDGGNESDGGAMCPDPLSNCAGFCLDTSTDNRNCGGCNRACFSGFQCVASRCVPDCDVPTPDPCGATCTDVDSDPDNCGGCGVVCESGLCSAGSCLGGAGGRVIVIGHDYVQSRPGMNRIVGNAIFLAAGATVEVLAFDKAAVAGAISGTDSAINQVATATGRRWNRTVAGNAAEVPFALPSVDVFLIYNQETSTNAKLDQLGASWAMALAEFIGRGGLVVLLDGAGTHGGTHRLLSAAGLFSATGLSSIADGTVLSVVDPGNAIATGVPSVYAAQSTSVRIDTTESGVVVRDGATPVVINKLF